MADIIVTGQEAYFNEDAKFFKDVYVYGTIYGEGQIEGPPGPPGSQGSVGPEGSPGPPGPSGDSYWDKNAIGLSTTSNVGIGTTTPTSALHIIGDILVSGVVTATTFYGDGSNLTGTLRSRISVSGITTAIPNNGIGYTTLNGYKSYGILKVGLSTAGWLRVYTDASSRSNDIGRSYWQDPNPGDGVILDVVTTGINTSFKTSPFVFGYNNDTSPSTNLYISITNFSGITTSISVNITIIKIEE
jgi:hypothetical protein